MKPMNRIRLLTLWLFACILALLLTLPALAAEAGAPPASTAPAVDWAQLLIPLLTPILIAGAKLLAPKIPSTLLPIIAPILGAGLDILLHYAGMGTGGPILGAILGSAGVGVREIVDQLRKRLPQDA
jgi:hypothetical protein